MIILCKHALGLWKGINIGDSPSLVTHSFFPSDTLLFGSSNAIEARKIKWVLEIKKYLEDIKVAISSLDYELAFKIC